MGVGVGDRGMGEQELLFWMGGEGPLGRGHGFFMAIEGGQGEGEGGEGQLALRIHGDRRAEAFAVQDSIAR